MKVVAFNGSPRMGRDKGEVEKDEEGVRTMRVLGENMAWLLKKLK